MWTESLLGRLCQLSDQSEGSNLIGPSDALQTFRAFDKFSEGSGRSTGSVTADHAKSRRLAWKSYYDTLSIIIHRDLPYEAESVQATTEKSGAQDRTALRLQQRAELKRVETIYENLLIKETHFPKASENNREIEVWVESVISNWRVLCGASWTDSDLGEGGKEGIGRSVIDVSIRANYVSLFPVLIRLSRSCIEPQPRLFTQHRSYVISSSCTHPWLSLIWLSRRSIRTLRL